MDPSSRYTLRAQVTPLGHQRMRDSLRTALWWLLPRDGDFRRAADGIHYYLARQGRRVVLRGGKVTSPLHESRLLWIHDPHHNQPPRVTPRQTVIPEKHDSVPRNNQPTVPRNNQQKVPRNNQQTVPRNKVVKHSDARARAPLENIPSSLCTTQTSLVFQTLALVSVTQCPGLIYREITRPIQCLNKQLALLSPLREKGNVNIEGRGVRERERGKK